MLSIHLSSLLAFYFLFFFFNDTATTEIYTLSLHDALPIYRVRGRAHRRRRQQGQRDQGGSRSHGARPQGGEGPGGRRAQAREGRCLQGGLGSDPEKTDRRRRQGRDQVGESGDTSAPRSNGAGR